MSPMNIVSAQSRKLSITRDRNIPQDKVYELLNLIQTKPKEVICYDRIIIKEIIHGNYRR